MPVVARSSRSNWTIWYCVVTSRPVVGSSAMRSRGRAESARAIMIRCAIPPESSCGYARRRCSASEICTFSSSRSASACASSSLIPRLSSSTCMIWRPTRITGLSASRGFWKIIEISLPRISRSSVCSGSGRRSRPRQSTCPSTTRPGVLTRPMIEAAVTDLPEPVSPASPTISPSSISKSRPSITRSSPARMKKDVRRPLSSSRAMVSLCAPPAWVEDVLQPVAEQVETEYRDRDREARKRIDPPVAVEEVLQAHADHHAPLGARNAHPESDEREPCRLENRPAAMESCEDDDGHERVRQQVAPEQAKPRVADGRRRERVLALTGGEHQVPHQARVARDVDHGGRHDDREDARAHRPRDRHREDEARERLQHVLRPHQTLVRPAAE